MIDISVIERVKELLAEGPATVKYDYFFNKLESDQWIEPLWHNGFFSKPPDLIRDERSVSFPFWSASRYLTRVADKNPELVAKVLLDIPPTDNDRVHIDIADAAAKLPGPLCRQVVAREIEWLSEKTSTFLSIGQSFAPLVEHLLNQQETDTAFRLFATLLEVRSLDGLTFPPYSTRIGDWEYGRLLERSAPLLFEVDYQRTLSLLCHLLASSLTPVEGPFEDSSFIWRPAIEAHEQNSELRTVQDKLLVTIRDFCAAQVEDRERYSVAIGILNSFDRLVFWRIKTFTLARSSYLDMIEPELFSIDNYKDYRRWHETAQLYKKGLSLLEADQAVRLLDAISNELAPSDENNFELYRWLYIGKDLLPPIWQDRFQKLNGKYGDLQHPDFAVFSTSHHGFESPFSKEELEVMSVEDLAERVLTFASSADYSDDAARGLGNDLCWYASAHHERLMNHIEPFLSAKALFVSEVVRGIETAVKKDEAVSDWSLYRNAVEILHARYTQGAHEDADRSPEDRSLHSGIARLLAVLCAKNVPEIENSASTWEAIVSLVSDPDPSSDQEDQYPSDPYSHAINTVRGNAIAAAVEFCLWKYRQQKEHENYSPEQVNWLLEYLCTGNRPSSPVNRGALGVFLPQLALMTPEWITQNTAQFFYPTGSSVDSLLFYSYLRWGKYYESTFKLALDQYSTAVDDEKLWADHDKRDSWFGEAANRLVEHVIVAVMHGATTFDSEEGVATRLFSKRINQSLSFALPFIGRLLRENPNLEDPPLTNLKAFTALILCIAKGKASDEVLASAGWLIGAPQLEANWVTENLIPVISGLPLRPKYVVIEGLPSIVDKAPESAVVVLEGLVRDTDDRHWVYAHVEEVREILTQLLANEATNLRATRLIEVLTSAGVLDYRSLL